MKLNYYKIYDKIVAVFIIAIIFSIKLFGIYFMGYTLFLDRIILILILILFGWLLLKNKSILKEAINIFILLILFYIIYSYIFLFSESSELIVNNVKKIVYIFELFLVYILFRNVRRIDNLNKVIIFLINIVCIVGILEAVGYRLLDLSILTILPKTTTQVNYLQALFYRGELVRISSFFSHSLAYGIVLATIIPYLFYIKDNSEKKINFKINITIVLSLINLFLTYSRIPIAITIIYLLLRILKTRKKYIISYIGIAILILILFSRINVFYEILFPDGNIKNDVSVNMRLYDYEFISNEFSKNIFLGKGTDSYYKNTGNAVDNYFLTLLYENGIISVLIFSYFITRLYKSNNKVNESSFEFKYIIFTFTILNITMDAFGFLEYMKIFILVIALINNTANIKERNLIK